MFNANNVVAITVVFLALSNNLSALENVSSPIDDVELKAVIEIMKVRKRGDINAMARLLKEHELTLERIGQVVSDAMVFAPLVYAERAARTGRIRGIPIRDEEGILAKSVASARAAAERYFEEHKTGTMDDFARTKSLVERYYEDILRYLVPAVKLAK